MPLSIDTNILVYALNEDSDVHEPARSFLESLAARTDVVIAELTLVELYLLIRNPTVFPNPYPAPQAIEACRAFARNPNWRIVECRPVMERVWDAASEPDFARRRIIDARLAFTLRAAGVTEFATRNTVPFEGFGFERVFDPLVPEA
ncbi:MAG: TA system VapC family ribonuclease toxin [Spirochaetota bacterium]